MLDPLTVPDTVPPSFWLAFGDVNVDVPVNCDPDCVSTSCNVAALVNVTLTGPVHVPANGVEGDEENGFNEDNPEHADKASVTASRHSRTEDANVLKNPQNSPHSHASAECSAATRRFA